MTNTVVENSPGLGLGRVRSSTMCSFPFPFFLEQVFQKTAMNRNETAVFQKFPETNQFGNPFSDKKTNFKINLIN